MTLKSDRIKIAILDHSPDLGGAEVTILTFLRRIDRSRFDVTVILPSKGAFSRALEEIDIPTSIIHLPTELIRLKRGKAFRSFLLLLISLFFLHFFLLNLCIYLRRNHFQLILTNTIKAHLYGSVAARLCSIPVVWRFHDVLASPDFSSLVIKFIVVLGRLFPTRILAVSKTTANYLVRQGIKNRKVEVIFNAIDRELFEIKGYSHIRDEYQLGDGVRLVGCIGRIIPQKGQKVFLLAIPEILQRYPDTFFLIIGDIFLKEETFKEELLAIMKRNGIEKRVRLTGFRKDIGKVIRSLDILVFPSIAPEAFPLTVLEAMSLGKPVIASDIGGISEIIEDGANGILVEPNRPEQIAEKIIYLFNHPEICDKIGEKAKEVVEQKIPLNKYVRAMENACWENALKASYKE